VRHLNSEEVARLKRLQVQREEHERSRKLRRKAKRLNRLQIVAARRHFASQLGIFFDPDMEREQIVLPRAFSFATSFDETAGVLEELREVCLHQRRRAMLHFSAVEEIEPAAALALVAEIFRIRNLRSPDAVWGTYPKQRVIYELLRDMGFFSLLQIKEKRDIPEADPDVGRPIFLRFHTDNKVDAEMVDRFVGVLEKHLMTLNELARGRLVAAIIEAMNNTLDHAHPTTVAGETMPRRWWMSSWVNLGNREVTVMLFDQGVGIPVTLDPTLYERVRTTLKEIIGLNAISAKPTDGEMILAATELYRTSTGQSGRGQGFRNKKRFVENCTDGELRVLSNRGRYVYMKGAESHDDGSLSIGGTVVEWRFRHDGSVEMKDE
jgi:hypothetical protein